MSFESFAQIWWWRVGVLFFLTLVPDFVVHIRGVVHSTAMWQNDKIAQEMSRLIQCSLEPWQARTIEEKVFVLWHLVSVVLLVFFLFLIYVRFH